MPVTVTSATQPSPRSTCTRSPTSAPSCSASFSVRMALSDSNKTGSCVRRSRSVTNEGSAWVSSGTHSVTSCDLPPADTVAASWLASVYPEIYCGSSSSARSAVPFCMGALFLRLTIMLYW